MTRLDYIGEQPELFRKALGTRKEWTEEFCRIFAGEKPDSIYLIASGTSGNAARAAAPFLEWVWERPVHALAPSCLSRVWGKRPLLLFISQGGKSVNMLTAAERMKGYLRIAVTGNADSTLNALCKHQILIPCGEEAIGPKTKGYTMTILLLYLLALESGLFEGSLNKRRYEEIMSALERTAGQFAENLRRTRVWIGENEDELSQLSKLYLAGEGQSALIAAEGALKVMETLMIPAFAFEFEEYLHGPSCSLGESVGGFYFLSSEEQRKEERKEEESQDHGENECQSKEDILRIGRMAAYHREISPMVFCCGRESGLEEAVCEKDKICERDKRDLFLLSSGQWFTRPFEEILPLQLISAVIPEKKGIEGMGMKCFKAIDQRLGVKEK